MKAKVFLALLLVLILSGSASALNITDDFEDGDLAEYSGLTGSFTVQNTTVYEGNYSLETADVSGAIMYSTSGLNWYPSQGDSFSYRTKLVSEDNDTQLLFGVQDSDSYYNIIAEDGGGATKFVIRATINGSFTNIAETTPSVVLDEWLRVNVTWTTDNEIRVALYNETGSEIDRISATNNTYTSGGIGFKTNPDVYYDYIKEAPPVPPSMKFRAPTSGDFEVQDFIESNVTAGFADNITIQLYNETGLVAESFDNTTPSQHNHTFSDLSYGDYKLNATAENTGGATITDTRDITLNFGYKIDDQTRWDEGTYNNSHASGGFLQRNKSMTFNITDDFEDNDLTEYAGATGSFDIQSTYVYNGSYALEATTTGDIMYSTSGLDDYPEQGEKFSIWLMSTTSSYVQPMFGLQDNNNFYQIITNPDDDFRIRIVEGGSVTDLATSAPSIPQSEWYRVNVTWEMDGDITAKLYYNNSTLIDTLSANDNTFTSGGIGYKSNPDAYYDLWRIYETTIFDGNYTSKLVDMGNSSYTSLSFTPKLSEGRIAFSNYTTNFLGDDSGGFVDPEILEFPNQTPRYRAYVTNTASNTMDLFTSNDFENWTKETEDFLQTEGGTSVLFNTVIKVEDRTIGYTEAHNVNDMHVFVGNESGMNWTDKGVVDAWTGDYSDPGAFYDEDTGKIHAYLEHELTGSQCGEVIAHATSPNGVDSWTFWSDVIDSTDVTEDVGDIGITQIGDEYMIVSDWNVDTAVDATKIYFSDNLYNNWRDSGIVFDGSNWGVSETGDGIIRHTQGQWYLLLCDNEATQDWIKANINGIWQGTTSAKVSVDTDDDGAIDMQSSWDIVTSTFVTPQHYEFRPDLSVESGYRYQIDIGLEGDPVLDLLTLDLSKITEAICGYTSGNWKVTTPTVCKQDVQVDAGHRLILQSKLTMVNATLTISGIRVNTTGDVLSCSGNNFNCIKITT